MSPVSALLLVLLCGLTHQEEILLSCPSGWSHYASHCYKLVNQPMGFNDAARVCYNYGASLARIFGFEENSAVAEIVESVDDSVKQYWIGFTRQYLDDPTDITDISAHWLEMGMEMEDASTQEGFWAPEQPAPEDGACGLVEFSSLRYYPNAWRMSECLAPHPFVCEAPAGMTGFFRCANGRYIRDSPDTICDGQDDCGDFSDESNCPSDCRTFISHDMGGTVQTPGTYGTNLECMWILEAPVGKRVTLRFTEFNTEKDIDIVELLIGGPTVSRTTFLARLSGNQNIGEMLTYHSDNNYMIVKFRSDSSVQMSGFTFEWNTEPQFPGPVVELLASEDMPQYITSPSYELRVGASVRASWVLSIPLERRVISLQVIDLDLPDCAFINFRDGEDFSAPMLDYISQQHNPHSVISTGNKVHVYYHTCDTEYPEYNGFNISYFVGCHGVIVDHANYLVSPGYLAGRSYPNYQTCTWLLLSPLSPKKIKMVFRSPFGLEDGVDTLTIYNGLDNTSTPVDVLTGTSVPGSYISQPGHFFLVMTTSSIINARGFKLEYSEECPPPPFNDITIYPNPFGIDIDDEFSVSCPSGYAFGQEEHFGLASVTLVGKPGRWSVAQTPNCEPIWCEQAPQINNGYYVSSTGAQYQDTVTYNCYAGYSITPYDTISCLSTGSWQSPPTCMATLCPQLDNTLVNGEVNIVGLDRVYGTVFSYRCNEGFEIVGVRELICQGDGTWSDDVPSCTRLRCPIELIYEVFSERGTMTPNTNVLFEDQVSVSCFDGYELVNAEDVTIDCLADQTFNSVPECEDVNECSENDGLGPCDLQCINTEGSFECTCDPGYTLDGNGVTCIDLDECESGEIGARYCTSQCTDFDGHYECSCIIEGYILYTEDGTEGFSLGNNEDGLLPGDILFINHTCVRNLCPEISDPDNGRALSYKTTFNFNDRVYFACDLGYELTGGEFTQCIADRMWSIDPSTITCEIATCEIPDVSGLTYAPTFDPVSGSVPYQATVEVTCNDHRPTPLVFNRQCLYDQSDNRYRLYLNGSDMECPIIDCGTPTIPSGSEIVESVVTTTYDSRFTLRCQNLYTQEGDTTLGSGVVTCDDTGRWDFGAMHCNGAACTDPGTKPGTIQNSLTTYDPGETVTYECIQDGFFLNGPSSLECVIDNTNVVWLGSPPTCEDIEVPVIVHSDCGTTVEIERLQPYNVQMPTATDNTGVDATSGLLLTWDEHSGALAQNIAIATAKTLTYVATDFAGNTDTCSIQVNIKDYEAPAITCPASYTVFIANEESTEYAIPTQGKAVTATDNNGGTPTITYSPESITLNSSIIDTWVVITATATDLAGNQASCQYMISIQAKICTSFSLRDPVNGKTSCAVFGNGFTCTITCNPNYFFHDLSDEIEMVSEVNYQCTDSGNYGITDVPDCVLPQRSENYLAFKLEYDADLGSDSQGCLQEYSDHLDSAVSNVAPFLQTKCNDEINSEDATVISIGDRSYNFDFDSDTKKLHADIFFKIGPATMSQLDLETCRSSFERQFKGFYDVSFEGIKDVAPSAQCPRLVHATDAAASIDLDPDSASYGEKLCAISVPPLVKEARQNAGTTDVEYFCFPCPPGTYYHETDQVCTPCPIGQYQPGSGSTECIDCPGLTSTYNTGSQTLDHCLATCETQPGFYASNNLAPCPECPKDTYSKYESGTSICEDCPDGTATDGTGAINQDDCKEPCEAGFYSDTGFMECIRCPQHFYQPSTGQLTCLECASDEVTGDQIPYTDASACLDGVDTICSSLTCQNSGTCRVANHHIVCDCQSGYTGVFCETQINYCTSSPCYYDGQCNPKVGGFDCICPSADYGGDRCETVPNFCTDNICKNGGMCKNTGISFECLCPLGYQGTTCQDTEDVCLSNACGLHGECQTVTAKRRKCVCDDGWTGETCETNIDDCHSNPCLYGFPCTDGDNDYSCACTDGYAGKNCEERPADVCDNKCQNTGFCIDDYRQNGFVCICYEGYTGSSSSAVDTWLAAVSGHSKLRVDGSCTIINYCSGPDNTCEEEGTQQCISTLQGPDCICETGFSGSKCQHNINDCAGDPCVHGECTDGDNTYTCNCDFGYTGTNCEADIEDCVLLENPCSTNGTDMTQGTDGCEDRVGDYKCFCKPGYRGKNCEIEINECMTFPCFHGGECEDAVNDFKCTCTEGWEGKRCDTPTQYCEADTCDNGAQCLSLFKNSFCQCNYPYYGDTCQLESSTCRDANPCVDGDSECLENQEGKAVCMCSDNYAGDGCQLKKNHCADENFCLNGGTCRRSMVLDEFECVCSTGFTGERCEGIDINACDTVTCPNSGECIPIGDDYICRCPNGLDGPMCDKRRDTAWDLCFYDSEYVGMAYKSYAIPLGAELEEFSVGMWMRFSELQGNGAFFTLYGLEYQNVNSPKRKLIELDSEQAHFTFSQVNDPESRNFGLYDINDRSWYYIMVTWVKATGKLQLFVNSARVHTVEGYAIDEDLPRFAMILLGSELEDDQSSRLTPEKGSGFNGCLSHVFAWEAALAFNTEVPQMADSRLNLVRPADLILDWKSYVTQNGVYVARPSTAGDNVCPLGFTGEDCSMALPDKEAPTVEECPSVVYERNSERLTQLSWEGPMFEGHSGEPRSTYRDGSVFVWGKYPNVVVAQDEAGNAAVCTFDIYVRQDNCEAPLDPEGGSSSCSDLVQDSSWPFRTCSASCNSGMFSIPKPNFYTCGPQGNFPTNHMFLTSFVYPSCAVATPRLVLLRVILRYRSIQACDELIVVSAFRIPLMMRLKELNNLWTNIGSTVGAFCHGEDCDDVIRMFSVCEELSANRRKRQSVSDAVVTIVIPNVQDAIENGNSVQSPEEVITSDILDVGGATLDNSIPGAVPDEASLVVTSEPICMTGQVLIASNCVDCGPGTFYHNSTATCVECPIGEYQESVGEDSCMMCPDGETTETVGSQDQDDCHMSCSIGSYFDLDMDSCQLCELGFYQDSPGMFFCWPCDAGETTPSTGSDSEDSCYEYCTDGTELTVDGQCQDCEIGYYRTSGIQARCTQCETGFVTPDVRSRTADDCTIPDCQLGQKIVGDSCEPCPIGTFQNEKWQDDCIDCPGTQTTLQTASTDVAQCLFFCPMGEEENPDVGSTCRDCAQGYYKDNEDPGAMCLACPDDDFVTPGEHAMSEAECNVLSCDPGERASDDQSHCIPCEVGSYQPEPYKDTCIPCPEGESTRKNGSDHSDDCEEFCAAGTERDDLGDCVPCPVGYYRDVEEIDKFSMCERCHEDFITATTGANNSNACNLANCTSGQYRDNNACQLCPKGEYQPEWWQTECIECDPDGQKTTDGLGATSEEECRLECQAGYEDPGIGECQMCGIGYYKESVGATGCRMCENGNITAATGANSSDACTVANCSPGSYRDTGNNVCVPCPQGTFEDRMWQVDECQPCTGDLTTLSEGADESSDCVTNCASGSGYDLSEDRCITCARGYYRTRDVDDVCVMCPAELITASTGALSRDDCDIRNCSAGTYRSSDNECVPCPRGKYQDDKWANSCEDCQSGHTTSQEGSTSVEDCIRDCPLGEGFNVLTGNCEICMRGTYKDATELTCQDCPPGTTTVESGSVRGEDCNISKCSAGMYAVGFNCSRCAAGTYEDRVGSINCKTCPGESHKVTSPEGATEMNQCESTDECALPTPVCLSQEQGGQCEDLPNVGFRCSCRSGWEGPYPSCTHKCDLDYCKNGGRCVGAGTDHVSCDCSDVDFEGDQCKTETSTTTEKPSYTNAIIGGAVGGGVGLILLLLIIVCCCMAFRGGQEASVAKMPPPMMAGPSPFVYNSMPTGVILKQNPAMSVGNLYYPGDAQSIAGYPGTTGTTGSGNSKYMFYDEAENGAVNSFGRPNNAFSSGTVNFEDDM